MRDYLRRTLSGQLPLFSLGADSAVAALLGKGAPRIAESQVDAKKVRVLVFTALGRCMWLLSAPAKSTSAFETLPWFPGRSTQSRSDAT
jgi:hypothetical protein